MNPPPPAAARKPCGRRKITQAFAARVPPRPASCKRRPRRPVRRGTTAAARRRSRPAAPSADCPADSPETAPAARSTPSPRASRSRHSFISNVPINMLRTLYTARQCHGSHGSGVVCRQGVFDRQRVGAGEKGVHPIAVCRQHVPGSTARHLEVHARRPLDAKPPHQPILRQRTRPGKLRPSDPNGPVTGRNPCATGGPEPSRGHLREECVVLIGRPQMRHAPAVAADLHRIFQAGKLQRRGHVGQGIL